LSGVPVDDEPDPAENRCTGRLYRERACGQVNEGVCGYSRGRAGIFTDSEEQSVTVQGDAHRSMHRRHAVVQVGGEQCDPGVSEFSEKRGPGHPLPLLSRRVVGVLLPGPGGSPPWAAPLRTKLSTDFHRFIHSLWETGDNRFRPRGKNRNSAVEVPRRPGQSVSARSGSEWPPPPPTAVSTPSCALRPRR